MDWNLPLRILVADPQPIACDGISALLSQQPDMSIVGQAGYGSEAIRLFCQLKPDVLIMERSFPDMDGRTVIAALIARFPTARILIVSLHEEEERIYTAMKAGAQGYFPKEVTTQALAEAIRSVCAGKTALPETIAMKLAGRIAKPELTAREREVLQQIVAGKANQEIAATIFIAHGTVKSHLNSLMAKLGVSNRTHAALVAIERGLAEISLPLPAPPNIR